MSHCCGPKEEPKKEEIRQPEIKEKGVEESLWQKLLGSLGFGSQEDSA